MVNRFKDGSGICLNSQHLLYTARDDYPTDFYNYLLFITKFSYSICLYTNFIFNIWVYMHYVTLYS